MRKTILNIVQMFLFSAVFLYGQTETPLEKVDSILFNYKFNSLYETNYFNYSGENSHLFTGESDSGIDTTLMRMSLRFGLVRTNEPGENFKIDTRQLLSPLIIKYENEQKMKAVRYVLGMAQTAAVGYLAYRHIKKYGLFK